MQGRAAGQQRRRLTELSHQDPLTEILKRRGFELRFADGLAKSQLVILLIVGLDGFKQINDRYGHEAGDDLLRWVTATALAERIGASLGTAVLGRDGDDFAALYAHADANLTPRNASRKIGSPPHRPSLPGPASTSDRLAIQHFLVDVAVSRDNP